MVTKRIKPIIKEAPQSNFFYLNHSLENLFAPPGIEILLSKQAYQKYSWVRQYFQKNHRKVILFGLKNNHFCPLLLVLEFPKIKLASIWETF